VKRKISPTATAVHNHNSVPRLQVAFSGRAKTRVLEGLPMEIHSLRASISEKDLNDLVARHVPDDQPIEDVKVRINADGVHLSGVYPLFVNVKFESHWKLDIRAGKVTATLAGFKAMGIPGNVFKSAILKFIAEAAKGEPWLQVEEDTILVDVDGILLKNGLNARMNLARVICQDGVVVIESGAGA